MVRAADSDNFLIQHTDFSLREQVNYPNGGISRFYDNGIDMVIIDENICDHNPGEPVFSYMLITDKQNSYIHQFKRVFRFLGYIQSEVDSYLANELSIDEFDLDHFVPRSYVSNDELWNLTPMAKKLNSSKNNKLPERRYIKDFVEYNYYLYSLIFANDNKDQAAILKQYFDRCENQHLNAIWATEKLYIPGNTKEQFGNILEENLSLVYDSAKLQEYEEWVL